MTTNHHTPIATGAAANVSAINSPLGELDDELSAQNTRIGTLESDMPELSGVATEFYNGDGEFTVPAGTGASIDGHVIKDEGSSLPQRASIDFVGAGVKVTNESGGTQVEIPGGFANIIINGGFDFWQRIVPTTATAMSDDVYNAPDRWYSLVQGAGATINRNAGIGTSQYAAKLVAGGTTNRYGIAQIVEAANSIPMRGRTVTAQVRVKPVNNAGSGTRDYRIAILEWTGTADTVTSELVAVWTSSTYTTAGFFASTTKTLVGTAVVTATHNVESLLSVTGVVSASCNNLIVFVWAEDVPTHAADYALVAEPGLYAASAAQTWSPRLLDNELDLCLRHYERLGGASLNIEFSSYPSAGSPFVTSIFFKKVKFYTPTITLYGTWEISNCGQPVVDGASVGSFRIYAMATGTGLAYFVTTDATTYIDAVAEL